MECRTLARAAKGDGERDVARGEKVDDTVRNCDVLGCKDSRRSRTESLRCKTRAVDTVVAFCASRMLDENVSLSSSGLVSRWPFLVAGDVRPLAQADCKG